MTWRSAFMSASRGIHCESATRVALSSLHQNPTSKSAFDFVQLYELRSSLQVILQNHFLSKRVQMLGAVKRPRRRNANYVARGSADCNDAYESFSKENVPSMT